jgi:3-oxoacyl-[acyl-carrier protein] reductase
MQWESEIQPLIASSCSPCHVGKRFGFASLQKLGTDFSADETEANYQAYVDLLSLDAPASSRLLSKMLSDSTPAGMTHAGGVVGAEGDAMYSKIASWIATEKADRCPACGTTAPSAYVAYVEQPEMFWAFSADPFRSDEGLRDRARILLQPVDPATSMPAGPPIDFLGDSFCGADGHCDFARLSASHSGDRLVFECRLSLEAADWVNDVRWNICIAEVGPDGKAQNPRFLLPPEQRHKGSTVARSDPFGLSLADGQPLKGPYDMHFQVRRQHDSYPVFSPSDDRVYFASQGPDPRTGANGTQAYHGYEHLDHIVSVSLEGQDARTIYLNDGGVADAPFFLRNGNVAFHTWNLERMDRHMYQQAHADGMGEIPVLLGRSQGPNMWGKATQIANGGILGATGRRRSSIENYVLFFGDHTLGTGNDPAYAPVKILDPVVYEEVLDFPTGYCQSPPEGPSCVIDAFYGEPAYWPDGRAVIAHNPEKTYVAQGEQMFLGYSQGSTLDERVESMRPYVPKKMGLSLVDHHGTTSRLLDPPSGFALRFPTWVGRRHPPRVQPWKTDETKTTADLHLADARVWLGLDKPVGETSKVNIHTAVDKMVALRVLVKDLAGNFCLNDGRPYRYAVNDGAYDHPTHLGINNATGYVRLPVPETSGGNAFGDVPLQSDGSVRVRVPAGKLLLFQGIDAEGHAVVQKSRLVALPPGQTVDTSVRRAQYDAHCMSCHGTIDPSTPFTSLAGVASLPFVPMDFDTEAAAKPLADASQATPRPATFLHAIRPLLDQKCVSCHSGGAPAGELSLEKDYDPTGNYPAGKWVGLANPDYLNFVPEASRVPSYRYSLAFAYDFREDEQEYKSSAEYAPLIASYQPLADLAPWDPAYQNLFAHQNDRWVYLGGYFTPNFGRSDRLGGISSDAYLLEVLTGKDLDPTRSFGGPDHTGYLSDLEVREVMAVVDVGFPYMSRCDDRTAPSGPNAGKAWGSPLRGSFFVRGFAPACSPPAGRAIVRTMDARDDGPGAREMGTGWTVVAGGSGGIGSAVVRRLASTGCDVAVGFRAGKEAAGALAAEVIRGGGRGRAVCLDLEDAVAVKETLAALDGDGGVSSVILAAGSKIPMSYVSQVDAELFRKVIHADVDGAFHLFSAALAPLRRSKGSIVAVTTAGNFRYPQKDILSVAPKAAIEALVRGIAREEGRHGIRANCVAVGVVEAGMFLTLRDQGLSGEWTEAAKRNAALRRFGTGEEVAEAVVFLASKRASYITGQTLVVDGGYAVLASVSATRSTARVTGRSAIRR